MSLRQRLLASTSFLISSVCVGAWAQAPLQPPPAHETPAAGTPVPQPSSPDAAPAATAPSTRSDSRILPAVTVVSPKRKPPPPKPHTPNPTNAVTRSAKPAPPPTRPPSAYETGGPNIGGGAAVAPGMASQMTISGQDLNARPVTHPGEILEAAPGLMVIEHADAGKANQYYLRGWNLDHGTDLATFLDDVPINLPTHAHGQGYTDLNWLIPETVSGLDVRKGPYFADVGDFENAGNLHISLRDTVDQNIQSLTVGSFGYARYLSLGSSKVGDGSLLYAGEVTSYAGPWTTSDDMKKFSGLVRYSQGTATDGFSLTGMAYSNTWNSTDQVALRAMTTGQIGLYGELDPTDGGDTSRFTLSARMAQSDDIGSWKANAYLAKYTMNLFNNFTWDTIDPVNGDQFHQHDDRVYGGGGISRTINGALFNLPTETAFGVQSRYDDITTALNYTTRRQFLSPYIYDHVGEGNAGIYAENTVHWSDWLRTTAGWRGDYFAAAVDSVLQPANSGNPKEAIGSPKFRMVIGPFDKTEFFVGAGMGYHSNDARSTVLTEVPGSPTTPEGSSPFLVRSRGAEVGVRSTALPDLNSSISLFYIHQDSELFFDGDTGDTAAGLPSQRTGVEFTNDYRIASWLHVDADLALSRARFLGYDQTQAALYQSLAGFAQAQIGNAPGDYVYNAPWMVASGGVTLGEKTGWFGALRWRYISSRPLTEDGAFQSPPMNVFNGTVGYRFENGWRIQIDAFNLLNSTTDQSTYAYGSLLTTDALFALCNPARGPSTIPAAVCQNGVMDYVYHPIEPLAIRLTLAGPLDTVNVKAMKAELKRAVPAYQAPAANYDWTGFYFGGHIDDSWSKAAGGTIDTVAGTASAPIIAGSPNWHGGIQAGYDYMMPSRVVIGLSADVSSGGTRVNTATDASGVSANQTAVFDSEAVRARLGYAVDNILFYGTGGWAWSNNQYIRAQLTGTFNNANAGTDEAVNTYLSGWTAGAGMAYAFAQSWNVFAEYRYTSYGSSTIALPFSQLSTTSTTRVSEVELGVNYKFNSGPPAAAGTTTVADLQRAASAPVQATKAHAAAEVYNWSGCYVGGDGGYGWGRSNGTLMIAAGVAVAPYSYDVTGPFSGLFIGGNYQINRLLAGVEGDWQRANLTGNNETQSPIGAAGAFPGGPFTIATTIRDVGSIRGRLGLAFDRFLVFGTAGWAWGNPSQSYALLGSAPFVSHGGNAFGWTAGAGLDYAFTKDVFGRVEYRYVNLETPGFVNLATNSADAGNRLPVSDMRVGIAYKFNPSSPI